MRSWGVARRREEELLAYQYTANRNLLERGSLPRSLP